MRLFLFCPSYAGVSGATRRTNLERLEELHKLINVKCLVTPNIKPLFTEPSFEMRIMAQELSAVPISTFVYDNQWVASFQSPQLHFTFASFQNPKFINSCQNYFTSHWQISRSLFPSETLEKRIA